MNREAATSSDQDLRDPREALRLAQSCAKTTGHSRPDVLGTLAAAHAAAGQFDQAIRWQSKALELAPTDQKPRYSRRLELYGSRQPYRERAGK